MSNYLNIGEIKDIIPHRYPFLMVDKAQILTPGKKGLGFKNVTINEPFFQGHFSDEAIMPGVLILEALAQVGAIVLLSEEEFQGKTPYFAGLNKVRFKRKVVPGDVLKMEVEITRLRGSIGIGQGKAFVDDQLACEGEFLFAID